MIVLTEVCIPLFMQTLMNCCDGGALDCAVRIMINNRYPLRHTHSKPAACAHKVSITLMRLSPHRFFLINFQGHTHTFFILSSLSLCLTLQTWKHRIKKKRKLPINYYWSPELAAGMGMDLTSNFHSLTVYHPNSSCVFFCSVCWSVFHLVRVCVCLCMCVCSFSDNLIRIGDRHYSRMLN